MYTIHFIGKGIKKVNNQDDAIFHLGAKYGASVYNEAVKSGDIVFMEDYAKVREFNIEL